MKKAAPTTDAIFSRLDANGDGKLSLTEFKNVLGELSRPKTKKPAPAADLEAVFKKLDANSDKSLSAAEFKTVATAVQPAAAAKKVKKAK